MTFIGGEMKKFLLICTAILFTCTQAFAFDVSPTQTNMGIIKSPKTVVSPELINKLFTHKSLVSGVEMLVATDDGNSLSSLRGTLSSPLSGDPVKAAREYLKEHSTLFNLPKNQRNDSVKLVKNLSTKYATHIGFQMEIDGIPVKDAKIELHLDTDKVVTLANGSFPTINDITNSINLSKYQAIGMAKQAARVTKMRAVPTAELALIPNNRGQATIAYVARIAADEPLGDYEVIVDAENGRLISYSNQMNFNTGTGALYATNPIRCDITKEPLKNLTTNTLTGKWVKVVNEKAATSVNAENTHIYTPESTHFEEVGMYYYVNTIHDFFASLGHTGMNKAITAVVHHRDKYDNAYFSPWQNKICFGDGDRFNCLAREAAITYHEYSHAVLNSITYLAYSGESGAINEGQADYFACSVTEDPELGEWVCAKMNRPYLRILVNDLHYPENIEGEVHADGKIWGATLWDIRTAIGKSAADLLIHNSHFYLNGSQPKFIDGFNALITADKNLYDGKYQKELQAVFTKRGIVAKSYGGIVLTANELKTIKKFRESHNE
jgi:Zn-dependent metalloprotease